jgi:uncharacterized protein YecE (DUF72 family)
MHPIHVGLSGWTYPHWRGRFYPPGLAQREELAYAAARVDSLEINASFYRLQTPATYSRWAAAVPRGFLFAVKGHRYVTHNLKLLNARTPLANILASGMLALGAHLGPMLWQLPAGLRFDAARLEPFLALLPKTLGQAAALAGEHEPARLRAGAVTALPAGVAPDRPLHHALEVRHPGFLDPAFFALMRAHGVAVAASDAPGWPLIEEVTGPIAYARLHGATALYASRYEEGALAGWAARLRDWARRVPVFVYFDNDYEARAATDALRLKELMAA